MNTKLIEQKKDYYEEYYPTPRVEKAIFNYLDQDYYVSEDNVFFTIYKKENDWFVNKTDIEDEIKNMFGLTLPDRIKIGPGDDDYIEPARNPVPKRVIQNWVNNHQGLKAHKEAMVHDKKKNSLKRRNQHNIGEDLENWGFDGKEIGPMKEQKNSDDEKERRDRLTTLKAQIDTNNSTIKNIEKKIKDLEDKDVESSYFGGEDKKKKPKGPVIGILEVDDEETQLSNDVKNAEIKALRSNIDAYKAENDYLSNQKKDLDKPKPIKTDSTQPMGSETTDTGNTSTQGTKKPIKISKIIDKDGVLDGVTEQEEPEFDEFSDEELEKRRTYDDFSDEEKSEIDQEYVDTTPFTKKEVLILKTLHKNLTKQELSDISANTPEAYGGTDKKFWNVMKLFGIEETNTEQNTRESRYAKWALDNWNEEGDYNIENPIKVPLKWYDVDREESGSQVEYKIGQAEVLGFDSDDAGERADYDFYAWGGEMETNDYGDYETYDSEITNSDFLRLDEVKLLVKTLREQEIPGLDKSRGVAEKEDFQELMYEVLRRVRQIPLDKSVSPRRIQEILKDDSVDFDLNIGADLNGEIHREYNRVRFYEYSQQLLKASNSKGVRGHYFEGLLAGLFNGEVVSPLEGEMTDPKEDVLINGINYSAKLVRAQDKKWGTASLLGGFKKAITQKLLDTNIVVPDKILKNKLEIKNLNELIDLLPEEDRESFQIRHMELFLKDPKVDKKYKEITLNYAFTSKSEEEMGLELHWIFGLIWGSDENFEGESLPQTNLKYYLIDTSNLIDGILDGSIHFTKGRNVREIRISESSMVDSNGASSHNIIFPKITRQDLKNLLYNEDSEAMVYKVMGIFKDFKPGTEKYIHHKVADVIADNPQEFIKKLQDLFPNKTINEETLHRVLENVEGKFYLNNEEESPILDVSPVKIAQKFSDVNGYGNIKFDMRGGNGIAYFTDKGLVIKLTADDSEYFTANKLVGVDNEYIVKVIESAKIKTSHSNRPIFVIVEESLPMTEEMKQTWLECCCGEDSPIYIDYLEEPVLVLPPVSEQDKCLSIYDNLVGIQKNFDEYGIEWNDIGVDNMGVRDGKFVVVDLGKTRGGVSNGKEITLTLENVKTRPLSRKQIQKQKELI